MAHRSNPHATAGDADRFFAQSPEEMLACWLSRMTMLNMPNLEGLPDGPARRHAERLRQMGQAVKDQVLAAYSARAAGLGPTTAAGPARDVMIVEARYTEVWSRYYDVVTAWELGEGLWRRYRTRRAGQAARTAAADTLRAALEAVFPDMHEDGVPQLVASEVRAEKSESQLRAAVLAAYVGSQFQPAIGASAVRAAVASARALRRRWEDPFLLWIAAERPALLAEMAELVKALEHLRREEVRRGGALGAGWYESHGAGLLHLIRAVRTRTNLDAVAPPPD